MAKDTVVAASYIDNFSIKDFAFNQLAPKYFDNIEDLSKLNIGAIGFTMEQISNFTEDTFNTGATLIKEAFPGRAQIPESIYSHSAIYQLSNQFAKPSKCTFGLIFKEDDIIQYGTFLNNYFKLMIDKNTNIQVEDKFFLLDYDIILKAQKYNDEYVYSAQYDTTTLNSISSVKLPYIKTRKIGNGYLVLFIEAKQYAREVHTENIIKNSKLNFPVITLSFSNQLAGFDVFYKTAGATGYTKLITKISYTPPSKTPFCYYSITDDNKIELTFSTKDSYFQPAFNSELKIVIYTTNGSTGNFESYSGDQVTVITTSENYVSNEHITVMAKVLTGSLNGSDKLDLEALQNLTVEAYSTSLAYNTENDIELYFNNYKYRYGNDIKVFKRRDDISTRLYSAFMIMKKDNYIYPTNTLNIKSDTSKFDISIDNDCFILRPGHVFTYNESTGETAGVVKDIMAYDNTPITDEFAFTNPYLIIARRKPNLVGYYLTVVNQDAILDYTSINDQSFMQFISNKISVYRNITKDSKYDINTVVMPSSSVDVPFTINTNKDSNQVLTKVELEENNLRVIMAFYDNNEMIGYIELQPDDMGVDKINCKFSGQVITDDYITSNNKFRCLNAVKTGPSLSSDYIYVPMMDSVVMLYTLYKSDPADENIFSKDDPSYKGYIVTNIYNTQEDSITFIKPMNMVRSTVTYGRIENSNDLSVRLSDFPLIKHDLINDSEKFSYLIKTFVDQYTYLAEAVTSITNMMSIDVKFYNTYGKSKNYVAGDDDVILDKVNLLIKFMVALTPGINESDTFTEIRKFIKKNVETLNNSGGNEFFISNLIYELKKYFPEISHLKFLGINNYDTMVQSIRNNTSGLSQLSKEERRCYVPEFLVMNTENVKLTYYE